MRLMIMALLATTVFIRPASAAVAFCEGVQPLETVVSLMVQRLALAEDVARYKWNQKVEIEDSAREQMIITKLKAQAVAEGLPEAWSETFFKAQIAASKATQKQLFAEWQQHHAAAFEGVPDLNSQTRPKLYALMSELITALHKAWQPLQQPECQPVVDKLVREKLAKPGYKVAGEPLFAVH
ncbi:gamma subclass chorismate mutase AroQ [Methylovulum psychrotolerans]|uniref:gamma subclass chorismate mutase AroQ n=1 Tax=Methylovulum psychrotolerans TaxID=1704499 RepID=UPI001BFF537C|nr:gamma subclass chorismate mutase AroQ [Methylovulum psychrotolerans]MBT9098961.1 gamma subclass chorismate mutase AroQ [Methylovulum psychrotolerans]